MKDSWRTICREILKEIVKVTWGTICKEILKGDREGNLGDDL